MSFREDKISVRGTETLVRRGGDGPPLVYLHSAGNEGWPPVLELLSAHREVIAPVAPGFPGTGGLEHVDHVSDVALHTVDVFEALGLDRPAVLGASLGGWVAAELAARYPKEVGPLLLVDAAGLWIDESPPAEIFGVTPAELADITFHDQGHPAAQMLRSFAFGFDAGGKPVGTDDLPPDELILPMVQALEAAARIAWNPYLHDPKLPRLLGRVRSPTLIVWGDHDRLLDPMYARRYQELIPGSEVRFIEGCGHMPGVERPDALAEIVEEFLDRVDEGR